MQYKQYHQNLFFEVNEKMQPWPRREQI